MVALKLTQFIVHVLLFHNYGLVSTTETQEGLCLPVSVAQAVSLQLLFEFQF
jgi:hypothetical protein